MDRGNKKYFQIIQLAWSIWLPCPYMVKYFKSLLFQNRYTDGLETWYMSLNTQSLSKFTNDDLWLTMTFSVARSNSGKCSNMRFHGKFWRFRPKNWYTFVLMSTWKFVSKRGQGHSLSTTLGEGDYSNGFVRPSVRRHNFVSASSPTVLNGFNEPFQE